jgi:hypothetical protein
MRHTFAACAKWPFPKGSRPLNCNFDQSVEAKIGKNNIESTSNYYAYLRPMTDSRIRRLLFYWMQSSFEFVTWKERYLLRCYRPPIAYHRSLPGTPNKRQALAQTTAASCSGVSPRTSASLNSTERTKAGSLRRFLLRSGAGVR